jgi:hypothetical protein
MNLRQLELRRLGFKLGQHWARNLASHGNRI